METPLSHFTFTPKPDWFERYKYYLLGGLLLILGLGLYLMFAPPAATLANSSDAKVAGGDTAQLSLASANSGQIVVDIAGGVVKPGIYWLPAGNIIDDAIKAASGFSRAVDLDAVGKNINRAQELTNHGKVYIPKIGDTNIVYTNPGSSSADSSAKPLGNSATSLININTADNVTLDLLPGIGVILSQRIVDYRLQNDGFKSIDDLKNVPGIGDKLFDQLKDLVTI